MATFKKTYASDKGTPTPHRTTPPYTVCYSTPHRPSPTQPSKTPLGNEKNTLGGCCGCCCCGCCCYGLPTTAARASNTVSQPHPHYTNK